MAETDLSHEFGREPGFSSSVLALNILICYTWRSHWDFSWMLNHRKTQNYQNCPNCLKFIQIAKLGFFRFMGLGQFLSVDWFLCLLWLRKDNYINIYITIITKPTTSVCASQESSDWEGGESSLVCLCHGSVYCASVPACQQCASVAEGHPWSVCASLNVSWRFQKS